jgi:hypothetical protein
MPFKPSIRTGVALAATVVAGAGAAAIGSAAASPTHQSRARCDRLKSCSVRASSEAAGCEICNLPKEARR